MLRKIKWNTILGYIFIALNFFWIFINIQVLYNYHFSHQQFYFKYPDWVLVVNILLCLTGEIISFRILRQEIKMMRGVLYTSAIWVACALINMISAW